MAQQIQIRRGTAADAVAADPVLAEGEQGYETDTGVVKIGDGTTPWASLPVAFTVGDNATSGSLNGTSILWDGDSYAWVSGTQSYAADTSRGPIGISQWTELYALGRLRPAGNLGVGGEMTADMVSRLAASVAVGADIVALVSPGINDVKGGVPVATTIANLETIFAEHIANGSNVLTITCPPSNLMDTVPEQENLFTLNRWLLDEATTRKGLIVADAFPYVASASAFDFQSGYSNDSVHPNATGSHAIGKLLAQALDKMIPSTGSLLTVSNVDPYELVANPRMVGGTAGVADSVTSTGGTGTASKVARDDDIPGEWQRWDGSATGVHFFFQDVTTGYSEGQSVVGRFEIRCPDPADWASVTEHKVYVEQRNSGNTATGASVAINLAASGDAPFHDRIIVETNPLVVNAAAVGGRLRVAHRFNGVAKVDIGAMSLRVLDT